MNCLIDCILNNHFFSSPGENSKLNLIERDILDETCLNFMGIFQPSSFRTSSTVSSLPFHDGKPVRSEFAVHDLWYH